MRKNKQSKDNKSQIKAYYKRLNLKLSIVDSEICGILRYIAYYTNIYDFIARKIFRKIMRTILNYSNVI